MDVSGSDLRAKIPHDYGRLKSLRKLNLANCDLYGTIPNEVAASLHLLETLDISNNGVDGTIPYFASTKMQHLVLKENRLHGPLPDPLPPYLKVLDVSHNHITGTIPWSYESLHSLAIFDVSFNALVGSLPYHIGALEELQVRITRNIYAYSDIVWLLQCSQIPW